MKFLGSSILLIFLLGSVGDTCFAQAASQATGQARPKSKLELTTHIIERKYCSAGGMLLILQSQFTNVGEDKLILFKFALSPFQYRISQSIDAAKAKRYEQVISPMMGSSPSLVALGDEPPSGYFVVLEPGQSYTPINSVRVPIFITNADQRTSKNYLGPGEHVLQVSSSTWPFHNDNEAEIRIRWQRFGSLWTKAVFSLPTVFQIEQYTERSPSDCNVSNVNR